MPRLAAIHQPNFLPWLGYFDKIARADVFVLLDHVQFQKKGGTWTNRVRLLTGGGNAGWVTVPVDRSFHGTRAINEMRIDESRPWRTRLLRTIQMNYAAAPHFGTVFPLVEELVGNRVSDLSAYNENAIRALVRALGLGEGKLALSSELGVEGRPNEMLIDLVRAVGADAYLAGGGAAGYQQPERFREAGIELVDQRFSHPTYRQEGDTFIAGLSVVDALMSCGFEGTASLLGRSST